MVHYNVFKIAGTECQFSGCRVHYACCGIRVADLDSRVWRRHFDSTDPPDFVPEETVERSSSAAAGAAAVGGGAAASSAAASSSAAPLPAGAAQENNPTAAVAAAAAEVRADQRDFDHPDRMINRVVGAVSAEDHDRMADSTPTATTSSKSYPEYQLLC